MQHFVVILNVVTFILWKWIIKIHTRLNWKDRLILIVHQPGFILVWKELREKLISLLKGLLRAAVSIMKGWKYVIGIPKSLVSGEEEGPELLTLIHKASFRKIVKDTNLGFPISSKIIKLVAFNLPIAFLMDSKN